MPSLPVHRNEFLGSASLDRVQGNVRSLVESVSRIPFAAGRLLSVSFTAGVPKTITHGLGTPAACFPIREDYGSRGPRREPLWVDRCWQGPGLVNLTNTAGNYTTGCSFTMHAAGVISGVRFLARRTASPDYTVKAKLYRNSDGALLAYATGTAYASRITLGTATFSAPVPVTSGSSYTVALYQTTGAVYFNTSTDQLQTFCPVYFGNVELTATNLYGAGDIRPTTAAGTESYWVEPIFAGGEIVEGDQTGLDANNQLSVISDRGGTVDLWFYPRSSEATAR